MNERIKELAKQAKMFATPMKFHLGGQDYARVRDEKFAELIVRECISINRQRLFSDYEGDSLRVAHNNALLCANFDMFDHFGVKE